MARWARREPFVAPATVQAALDVAHGTCGLSDQLSPLCYPTGDSARTFSALTWSPDSGSYCRPAGIPLLGAADPMSTRQIADYRVPVCPLINVFRNDQNASSAFSAPGHEDEHHSQFQTAGADLRATLPIDND